MEVDDVTVDTGEWLEDFEVLREDGYEVDTKAGDNGYGNFERTEGWNRFAETGEEVKGKEFHFEKEYDVLTLGWGGEEIMRKNGKDAGDDHLLGRDTGFSGDIYYVADRLDPGAQDIDPFYVKSSEERLIARPCSEAFTDALISMSAPQVVIEVGGAGPQMEGDSMRVFNVGTGNIEAVVNSLTL